MTKVLGACAFCSKPVLANQRHLDHRDPRTFNSLADTGEVDDRLWHYPICYAQDLGIDQDAAEDGIEALELSEQLTFFEDEE